jgi:hypothetical protein
MNLDDTQKKKVATWLEEGLKLSDIQKKISTEFGISIKYLDLRFLLDDLKLKPKEEPRPPAPAEIGKSAKTAPGQTEPFPAEDEADEEELPAADGAKVSVTVDQVARPGALVSGGVTFSDGNSAQWYLDQAGRLGLVAKEQGYRPSQPDLMAFQSELQRQLAQLGF